MLMVFMAVQFVNLLRAVEAGRPSAGWAPTNDFAPDPPTPDHGT
jgi:hypothetical protein